MARTVEFLLTVVALLVGAASVARGTPRAVPAARPRLSAQERVMEVLRRVERQLQTSAYVPVLIVDEAKGRYDFDCSAMAGWVLRQAAPRARATVKVGRPAARDFARAIAAAPPDRPPRGWQRVSRIADAQPGDVLAWKRPPWFPSRNTGHVAFVVAPPVSVPGGVLVRIADATSLPHQDDSRIERGGFGIGTLAVTTDPTTGAGTGYGWFGQASLDAGYVVPAEVVVGRVER